MKPEKRKSIVVGIDGSSESFEAARYAADLARRTQQFLELVFVRQPILLPPVASYAETLARLDRSDEAAANEVLKRAVEYVAPLAAGVGSSVVVGSPVDELIRCGNTYDASMLVVGSRGRGALGRLAFGSVADGLLHGSPLPVLVFHLRDEASGHGVKKVTSSPSHHLEHVVEK